MKHISMVEMQVEKKKCMRPTEQFIRVAQTVAVSHIVTMIAAASLLESRHGVDEKNSTDDENMNGLGSRLQSDCLLFRKACGGTAARFSRSINDFHSAAEIHHVLAKCVPFLHKIYTCVAIVSEIDRCADLSTPSKLFPSFGQ